MKEFKLSLAIQPDQAAPHTEIAEFSLLVRINSVNEELTLSLQHDPANADAHNSLGVALAQLGEYDKAVEQFKDALRIDPEFAGAEQNLECARAQMNSNAERSR